jgi:uncharacterized membrane protein
MLVTGTLQRTGEEITFITDTKYRQLLKQGDKVRVYKVATPEPAGAAVATPYVFHSFNRTFPISLLVVIYCLVIILIARLKGVRAIAGLILGLLVVTVFTIPALFAHHNTLLIGLISSVLIMFASLYLAHGFNIKTSTALLGTILGLTCTSLLGALAVWALRITGFESEEALKLSSAFPVVSLSGIASCGIIISALGVLNDVTITQASTVAELYDLDSSLSRTQLFFKAMRVGKDHIASTVYTIAFAHIGASLPVMMWIYTSVDPLLVKLTSETLIGELTSTLVSGIGLVLSIPLTTLIAAWARTKARPPFN